MANPFNFSCDIVDRKLGFYNFNFEKLLSTNVTVKSIVNNIIYSIDAFGTIQFLDKIKYICRCLFFFW
jgi:hypothetical protein